MTDKLSVEQEPTKERAGDDIGELRRNQEKQTEDEKPTYGKPGVTILNPVDANPATQGAIPYSANGTTSENGAPIVSMTYQVNNGPAKNISSPYASWSFTLSAQDCPNTGITYTITVNAWNGFGKGTNQTHLYRSS